MGPVTPDTPAGRFLEANGCHLNVARPAYDWLIVKYAGLDRTNWPKPKREWMHRAAKWHSRFLPKVMGEIPRLRADGDMLVFLGDEGAERRLLVDPDAGAVIHAEDVGDIASQVLPMCPDSQLSTLRGMAEMSMDEVLAWSLALKKSGDRSHRMAWDGYKQHSLHDIMPTVTLSLGPLAALGGKCRIGIPMLAMSRDAYMAYEPPPSAWTFKLFEMPSEASLSLMRDKIRNVRGHALRKSMHTLGADGRLVSSAETPKYVKRKGPDGKVVRINGEPVMDPLPRKWDLAINAIVQNERGRPDRRPQSNDTGDSKCSNASLTRPLF